MQRGVFDNLLPNFFFDLQLIRHLSLGVGLRSTVFTVSNHARNAQPEPFQYSPTPHNFCVKEQAILNKLKSCGRFGLDQVWALVVRRVNLCRKCTLQQSDLRFTEFHGSIRYSHSNAMIGGGEIHC